MAKRAKTFVEVQEEFRPWPYGETTEPYRYMMEVKPVPKKRARKTDPYSALTSKPRSKKHDKHPS